MIISENNARSVADHRQEILFKTYSYQNGKGQETVYYRKDCVEISMDACKIPVDADNYEEVRKMLKSQNSGKIAPLENRMFYETYEVMKDYYAGKLDRDEVKDIFKEYFYHYMGKDTSLAGTEGDGGAQKAVMYTNYKTQMATRYLAGLYEHFSRANTRNACAQNSEEGKALMEDHGMSWNGTCYYNADWYYACEEMQELFRQTADELADEYGADHVDFKYVEENTRFTLDGGITYNGVWDAVKWQISHAGPVNGRFQDQNMAPPRGFVYCSSDYAWNGKGDLEGVKEAIKNRRKGYSSQTLLLAAGYFTQPGRSLLFDAKNYSSLSEWREGDLESDAFSFLKNFDIHWQVKGNRWECLFFGQ